MKADRALSNALNLGNLTKQERTTSRQGLYVLGTRNFERFLEEQLIAIACGTHKWTQRLVGGKRYIIRSRVPSVSTAAVTDIIKMNRDYFDPLPWEKGVGAAAKKLLYGEYPFTLVESSDRNIVQRVSRVRNCIAHDSEAARAQMMKSLSQIPGLSAKHKKSPTRYLNHEFSLSVDYFAHDLTNLLRIGTLLS